MDKMLNRVEVIERNGVRMRTETNYALQNMI